MAKKKDKKKKIKKTDYKAKYKKLKVKYKKLKAKLTAKPKKEKSKKVKEAKNTLTDHSSNYNVKDAVKKIRSLKNANQVSEFIKSEKRVTVTRTIKGVLNRLAK
jgi:hypothetical protein